MELSNKEVYTTTTRDFGKGFLFPNIDIDLPPLGATPDQDAQENDDPRRQEIPLSAAEISLAAAATPEGVDYAFTIGEFGGLSDLAAEGLGHAGIQITYLGTPAGGSLDLAGVEEEVGAESSGDAAGANDPAHFGVGESCPVLYPLDWDLIGDLRSEGGSTSIERALRRYDAESLLRVVGAGFAVGEVAYGPYGEERMFSLTDATNREVLRAAHEEAALRAEARHLASAGERAGLHTIARSTLMVRGSTSGGAATLECVLGRLTALTRFSRSEARGEMRALIKAGALRCRVVGGRVLLGTVAAPAPEYARAARTAERAERQSRRNSRIRTKVFADGAWIPPERESGPDPHGERVSALDAERAGEAVITTATGKVIAPSLNARQRQAAQRRVNRALANAKAKGQERERARLQALALACRAAAEEALKAHLGTLAPAERLELVLQVRGEQDFARMERSASDKAALKEAARELLDSGRISIRKEAGKTLLSATAQKPADLGKTLVGVIARTNIPVPKGTRLARRVAAQKTALTRKANAPANAGSPTA